MADVIGTHLADMVDGWDRRRAADAARWAALDPDRCQLCEAAGPDMRTLWISCLYAVHEAVPEAMDTAAVPDLPAGKRNMYALRICKSCRAALLTHLAQWRAECVALRGQEKDSDGELLLDLNDAKDSAHMIPVREHGATRWLTPAEWVEWNRGGNDAVVVPAT